MDHPLAEGDGRSTGAPAVWQTDPAHLRQLLDHLPAGAYACDPDGLITYYNEPAVDLWGRAPRLNDAQDRFCGSFRLYAADGSPIDHDACWMALALRNDTGYNSQEIIVERPNGERLTVLAHANPIREPGGRLIGAVNVLVDITRRKHAEQARHEHEAQFRAAMEGSMNAFFILRAERDAAGEIADFVFVDLNSRGEALIGIPRARAVGGRLLTLLPANRETGFFDKYRRVVETGAPLVEEFGECAAGHVDAWFWQQVVPLGDGVTITTADVTDRKRNEVELQERLRHQSLVHDLSTDVIRARSIEEIYDAALAALVSATHADRAAVLLFDPDGVMRFKAWRGLSDGYRAAVEGHTPWREDDADAAPIVVPDVARDPDLAPFREVVLGEGIGALAFVPLVYERRLLGKFMAYGDAPRPFTEAQVQLAQTIANHVAFAIERKRSEQARAASEERYRALSGTLELRVDARTRELERANDLLGQRNRELQDFAHVASHDLQEPLRKFRTFLSLLQTEVASPSESVLDYVRRMDASAERMSTLITALLTLSRVTTRADALHPTDLAEVAHEVIGDLEVGIAEANATVEIGPMCTVRSDPQQMRQLLQNLIANAVKFRLPDTPAQVRVFSESVDDGGTAACRIVVSDNGVGFDEKYVDRIFAPFQRLHGRDRYPGTGMGLAICRRIAERHGGIIEAHSTPGAGSTFTVTLPLQPPVPPTAA